MLHLGFTLYVLLAGVSALFPGALPEEGDVRHLYPITSIAIGLGDDAHVLPYVLGWLESIEYPKHRLHLDVYLSGKEDSTADQVLWWRDGIKGLFASVNVKTEEDNWMEAGLRTARLRRSTRLLMTDGHSVITDNNIIKHLSDDNSTELIVFALMNPTVGSERSNLVDEIEESVKERKNAHRIKIISFSLPALIRLDAIDSSYLTFDSNNVAQYTGIGDPMEVFGHSASKMNISIWLDNFHNYGFYIDERMELTDRRLAIRYHLCDMIADDIPLPVTSRTVRQWTREPERWSVDKIYLINLARRPDRLRKMTKIFETLGIDFSVMEATDGTALPNDIPYTVLHGYLDPFHKRPIKSGEIGCFLSHYKIWQDVVEKGYSRVIVFEDDLRFSLGGMERIVEVLEDLDGSKMDWHFVYLGRKKQADQEELWVANHRHLSTVGYSYWTLGYLLSLDGANTLIRPNPLMNLLPVDEYIPIMFDKHPNSEWSSKFPVRDLKAFTLYPLVVSPQRYTNEPGYVSDTEQSEIIQTTHQDNELELQRVKEEL